MPGDIPAPPRPSRLIIVDQGLRELGGHHAEYTLSVAACAAPRMPVIILTHARCAIAEPDGVRIVPTFRFEWTQPQRAAATLEYDPAVSFNSRFFLADLRAGLARAEASRGDHVFIHTIGFDEIEDLLAYAMSRDRAELATFHILLRRDLDEIGDEGGRRQRFSAYVRAFARIGFWPELARFYADTDHLSAHYAGETGVPFATLPIPFDEPGAAKALRAARQRDTDRPVIVGYLGSARFEKGYQHLPAVAAALQPYLDAGEARLRLQSTLGEAAMIESRRQLEAFGGNAIELLYWALSGDEYYRQLGEMDIVLLPYVPERYRRRSSGIFAQAVAAGKIVVVPRGTTMWAWVEQLGIASCVPYDTPSDLPAAVMAAVERCDSLRETAYQAGEAWLARQPTLMLLDRLLRPAEFAEEDLARCAGPRILHILDGPRAFQQRETAQRTALRCGVFQRLGCQVLTIVAVPACPSRAELAAWLSQNYQHWFSSDCGFSWLLYLTQPGQELASVAAELRNGELFSIPESLPATLAGAAIDAVWTDSLMGLSLVDLLELDRIPVVFDRHEISSLRYALQRRSLIAARELTTELSLLRRDNIVLPRDALLSLYLPGEGCCLAAFPAPSSGTAHRPNEFDLSTADVLLVVNDDDPSETWTWFCESLYLPHLSRRGMNLAVAGSIAAGRNRCGIQQRFPQIAWIDARIGSVEEAYAAGRIIVLPIEGTAAAAQLSAAARCLSPMVTVAENIEGFAAQLADLVEKALRPAPPTSLDASYLPAEATGYIGSVERLLQTALGKDRG
jgi:hypothetical protein